MSDGALAGLLVIAIEQAVAAPLCTVRLADAGARVIKIERAEGGLPAIMMRRSKAAAPILRGSTGASKAPCWI